MKIVLLTSVAGNGGSAATAYHNTKVLRSVGEDAVLFAPGEYWPERGKADGIPVRGELELRRGLRLFSFCRDFLRLRGFLKKHETEAVIVQKSPEQWLAFFVLMFMGRRILLVRLRGVVFPIKPSRFNRWLHNRMDLVLCSASRIRDHYRELLGFRQESIQVFLEGVDTTKHAPATIEEREIARGRFKLDQQAVYLGTAGRPAPVKGHDLLLRAFAKAVQEPQKTDTDFRLVIFSDESRRGPGSYPSLEGLAEELGVRDRVDLCPGFLEDIRDVYRSIDAYILPSRGSEGSSRAALEARASGLPVIASDVGVLPDLIEDGVNGRLVPPDDEAALSAALRELMEQWPAAKSWGQEARALSESRFKEEDYARQLADKLRSLKKTKGA